LFSTTITTAPLWQLEDWDGDEIVDPEAPGIGPSPKKKNYSARLHAKCAIKKEERWENMMKILSDDS
jgi:hypothetical protein